MENNINNNYPYYLELKKDKENFDKDLLKYPYDAIYEYKKAVNKLEEIPELIEFVLKNSFFPTDEFKEQLKSIKDLKYILKWIISADELITKIESLKKEKGVVIINENSLFFIMCNHIQTKIFFYILNYLNYKEITNDNVLYNNAINYSRRIKSYEKLFIGYKFQNSIITDDINMIIRKEKLTINPILNKIFEKYNSKNKDKLSLYFFNNLFIFHYINNKNLNISLHKTKKYFNGETNYLIKELPIYYNTSITLNQFCKLLFPLIKHICPDKDLLTQDQYLNKHKNNDAVDVNDYKRYMVKMVKNNVNTIKVL